MGGKLVTRAEIIISIDVQLINQAYKKGQEGDKCDNSNKKLLKASGRR